MDEAKKIERFEDLRIWQMSFELCKDIYKMSADWKLYGLKDQIQRSSLSVPSNIAEGFERKSDKELLQFLFYAKGSAAEVRTPLYLAKDLELMNTQIADELIFKVAKISSMINNFIVSKCKTT